MKNLVFSSEKNLSLFNIENDYILFQISDDIYAIKILDIKEIISNRKIVEIEDLPKYITGIVNIRNVIFPIFDLKKNLPLENFSKYGKYSVIVIFESSSDSCALLADSVLDIYNIPEENIKVCSIKENDFIEFEVELNQKTVKIINVENLIKLKYDS